VIDGGQGLIPSRTVTRDRKAPDAQADSPRGAEHGTAPLAPWNGGRPRAAAAGGAVEPDALRGARRAGPQFPRPITCLASLPRRVAAARLLQ